VKSCRLKEGLTGREAHANPALLLFSAVERRTKSMDGSPSPAKEREIIEQELLARIQVAEKAYRSAAATHSRIRIEYGDMLDNPDGAHALHKAAKIERMALEEYTRALSAFSDLVLHNRGPISPGDPD
jgi:hypothetical protein